MTIKPTFLESLHHVPGPDWTRTAFGIVRAGKVSAGPAYRIVRDAHIGQDIDHELSGTRSSALWTYAIAVQPPSKLNRSGCENSGAAQCCVAHGI